MEKRNSRRAAALALLLAGLSPRGAYPQATSATFGEIISLGGTPSDVVLDESRGRLYLVNQSANQVEVYSYLDKQVVKRIPTGQSPVAAAMSMDAGRLYVSNNGSSSLTVIDLSSGSVLQTVALSAKPEGLEVGVDGRVLITTEGASSTDNIDSLQLYDPRQTQDAQVTRVPFAPPPATPSTLPALYVGRPTTTFRGKLIRTPDGQLIIGMSNVNNNALTVVFVYEVFSGTILRSRSVTGQSTVLSLSPDGARFMAGFTLYDTATLNVLGQLNGANVPFPIGGTTTTGTSSQTPSFNTVANIGGSVFSPDGATLYSAFNVAAQTTPASRPLSSTLLILNPRNLGVRLGIKAPESIIAKMVMLSNGEEAWGLSESGLLHLPLSKLYDYPILMPESTTVHLAVDDCNRGLGKASLRIDNIGKGRLTFSVPDTTSALIAQATSGLAPSQIHFTMEPGRSNLTRQYGTNLYSGAASNTGLPLYVNLSSPDAINIPPTIQVFMNYRQPDQRGTVFPIETGLSTSERLHDILMDEQRNRVYITNAGKNRIEVFDTIKQRFVDPIEVGQLPHQMAMAGDGKRLYVANTGGESISILDLDSGKIVDSVKFPARPRSGTANPISPQAIANTLFGLQIAMSDGSLWKASGTEATVRQAGTVVGTSLTVSGNNGPVRMLAEPGGESMITMAGNGTFYRYDGLSDDYRASVRPYTATQITGFYGPLAAGVGGTFFGANGFILGPSLAVIGGAESPTSTTQLPLASRRNVAALGAIDDHRFLRLTTPVKQTITTTPTSDPRPTLEIVDIKAGSVTVVGAVAENPQLSLFGTTRTNIPPRQIAVDSKGNAYVLTLSGLSVIPLSDVGDSRPQVASGSVGILNANDGTRNFRPGSFVAITGQNLAASVVSDQLTPPVVLGGSCVTFSDHQLRLLSASPTQIIAQIPEDIYPGNYVAVVRSLATGQRSDPVVVSVQ